MAVEKKFVREAVNRLLIREHMHRETERAGFGGIDIQRTPMGTRVSVLAERPGMIIGRKGSTINALTDQLSRRFKVENPQIEVVEAGRDSALNAQIMATKLAEALERGWHFRRAGHSTVQRVMQAGALGCQVVIAGKLTGQRHRTEKFVQGHIKYCGDTLDQVMDVGFAVCKKKLGVMGCTVRIMRPGSVLPDMITIHDVAPHAAPAPEKLPRTVEPAEPLPEIPVEGKKKEAPKKPRAPRKKKEPKAEAEAPAESAPAETATPEPAAEPAAAEPPAEAAPAEKSTEGGA
jgi:small subunit ribosomal protein S3